MTPGISGADPVRPVVAACASGVRPEEATFFLSAQFRFPSNAQRLIKFVSGQKRTEMMNLAARRLQPLLLLSAALMCACRAQVTHTPEGGLEADEHLHQSQIPPPSKQPSEEEIKDAIATLIDESIDTNKDGTLSAEELKAWLNINHNKIMDENINRQWNYYKPNVQEVHSWEGYEPAQKEVLQWDQYKVSASNEKSPASHAHSLARVSSFRTSLILTSI